MEYTRFRESEMIPETPQGEPRALPVCPYCGTDPAPIATAQFNMGPLLLAAFFCGVPTCRRMFSVVPLGMVQSQPRVVVPGGPAGFRN